MQGVIVAALLGALMYPSNADYCFREARKALNGHYGALAPWQRAGYEYIATHNLRVQGRAWLTYFWPSEGFPRGQPTRSGRGVSERTAAVARFRWAELRGAYVWTAAGGLRIIEDTGANKNERIARCKGAQIWIDFWAPNRRDSTLTYYVIFRLEGEK